MIESDKTDEIKKLQEHVDVLDKIDKSEDRSIFIYRQYFTHNLLNARVVEVKATYSLWIPKGAEMWIYELPKYLASLSIKDSDGNSLPILSDAELNVLFTNKNANFFTQDGMKQTYAEQFKKITKSNRDPENYHYVGIIFSRQEFDRFEEITITWTEQINKEKTSKHNLSTFVMDRHIVEPTTDASVYVNITMDGKKYEFAREPSISVDDINNVATSTNENEDYRIILKEKSQCVLRIKRHVPKTFTIRWSIGIPKFVRIWAWLGFLIAASVLCFSTTNFIIDKSTAENNVKLLAGLIAVLVGFRVLLFHDIELMTRWNWLYVILLTISVSLIFIMYSIK